MAYTSKKLIAQNLKKNLREYRELYENAVRDSYEATLRSHVDNGSPMPAKGKIVTEQHRESFINQGRALREKTLHELDEWRKQVNKAKAAAPSDDATRAVQAFQQINPKTLTREAYQAEAQNIADQYGDNYLTYMALKGIALAGDARLDPHPLVAEIENFESIERLVSDYFNPYEAASTTLLRPSLPTAGKESFAAFFIDELMASED